MKSICIKITNSKTQKYLLDKLNDFKIKDVYFSCKKFKIFQNIIIHYKGNETDLFIQTISELLSSLIMNLFEENIIRKLIQSEYFYFDNLEQVQICQNTFDDLYDEEEAIYSEISRFQILRDDFVEYLRSSHSIVLRGFVTFRTKNYLECLLEQIDKSVNKFVVEKEYVQFIKLLKAYVNSEPCSCDIVHLVYHNNKPILLDRDRNLIDIDTDLLNSKYLSDISFSSNDYVLNTLLNLIPEKIYIHLINSNADEFINTVKLIFENRVKFWDEEKKGTQQNI